MESKKVIWFRSCLMFCLVCVEERDKFSGMLEFDREIIAQTPLYETATEVKEALVKEVRLIGEKIVEGADSIRKEIEEEQKR